MRGRSAVLLVAAILLMLAGTGTAPAGEAAERPNLLLVTIDTLRADHLHAYGDAEIETPVTDRLAREGVLVEDATVQVPETRPSHASILTGLYPFQHGIRDNFSPPLRKGVPTLASVLSSAGYDTGGFIGALPVSALSGLDRGFATFDDPFSKLDADQALVRAERRGDAVVSSALAWLRKPRSRPFFAWVHLYDPHEPYDAPPPYGGRYAAHPYDGEVAYADAQVGRLLRFLDERKLRASTLVVVTADHGEGLGDHGEQEHLLFVYDSTLHVPLILSRPGSLPAGVRVGGQFRSVDLFPTVLDLLGVSGPAVSGVSRAAVLEAGGRIPENESYAEGLFGSLHFGYAPLRALRTGEYKFIDAPRPELYHLTEDPGETRNLVGRLGRIAQQMRDRLRSYDAGEPVPSAAAPVDPGVRQRMLALGYVGGGTPSSGPGSGADPKDKIAEYEAFIRDSREALRYFGAGKLDEALPLLERLSASALPSFDVEYFLGRTLLRKGEPAKAVPHLQKALAMVPDFVHGWADLATAEYHAGDLDAAQQAVERGSKLEPGNPSLEAALGLVLQARGELPGAQQALEKALAADAHNPRLRLALSAVYRDLGQVPRAIEQLQTAVRDAPRYGDGWHALGMLLESEGRNDEALEAFQHAYEWRPRDPNVLYQLASAWLRHGDAAKAESLFEALVARAPRFPGAQQGLEAARQAAAGGAKGGTSRSDASQAAPAPAAPRFRILVVADRAAAEAARSRLAAGADFAALARSHSLDPSAADGGSLGSLKVEDLAEPLRSAARRLAPGETSPVLEMDEGYALLHRDP